MTTYLGEPTLVFPRPFTSRHWWVVGITFFSYCIVATLSIAYVPTPSLLYPVSAIAITALFLEGLWLWPVIYIAALCMSVANHAILLSILILPVAHTLQALLAAYLMKRVRVDPLFRRVRDIFWLVGILLGSALIVPTVRTTVRALGVALSNAPVLNAPWSAQYMAEVFGLLILVPFLLRWLVKIRFSRTLWESAEILGVFALLIGVDYLIFIRGVTLWGPIALVYILLVPLFWIALRLRPRFVTLAIVITSIFGIASLFSGAHVIAQEAFPRMLFNMQAFLTTLAFIFFVIVSLEENRRLNGNLLRNQLATLENAIARVSSESRAKNDFIAVLAHELRNPLAPIASAIDFLRLSPGRSSEEMETFTMMEDRMQTIRRLLDDLLDISRITEGKMTLKKEVVDLETVVRSAVISTDHYFTERHQTLTVKTPSARVLVNGDTVRLEQILSNLLTNASKYSDSGDRVTLSLTADATTATIVVKDEGLGIDPSDLDTIFTPFHQGEHGARTRKGLGVGLALVRNFVELHDGSVIAESKGAGKGSTFTVRLPLAEDQHATAVRRQAPGWNGGPNGQGKRFGPSVLVVDDNDAAAWGVGKLLELRGCSVEYAYSAKQAIEKTLRLSPQIVLLDLGLPDQDGYEAAKAMRARGYRGKLVALTGWSGEESRVKVRESGFEGYVVKPAGLADLQRVIPQIG